MTQIPDVVTVKNRTSHEMYFGGSEVPLKAKKTATFRLCDMKEPKRSSFWASLQNGVLGKVLEFVEPVKVEEPAKVAEPVKAEGSVETPVVVEPVEVEKPVSLDSLL